MGHAVRVAGGLITSVGERLRPSRRWEGRRGGNADLAGAPADVDGAAGLMHVYATTLTKRTCGLGEAVGETTIVRPLNHRHGRLDRSIEQVHFVFAVEFLPLPIVFFGARRRVAL